MTDNALSPFVSVLLSAVCVALLWIGTVYMVERRKIKLQEMADRLGMTIPKSRRKGLPGDLSLSKTKFAYWTKMQTIFACECNGCSVTFFDCQIGSGKGMQIKTVVAVRSDSDMPGLEELGLRLKTQRAGHWLLIYQRRGFNLTGYQYMRAAHLEKLLHYVCAVVGG